MSLRLLKKPLISYIYSGVATRQDLTLFKTLDPYTVAHDSMMILVLAALKIDKLEPKKVRIKRVDCGPTLVQPSRQIETDVGDNHGRDPDRPCIHLLHLMIEVRMTGIHPMIYRALMYPDKDIWVRWVPSWDSEAVDDIRFLSIDYF